MPRARHPREDGTDGFSPAAVDVDGERREIDDDGEFEYDDEIWLETFADRHSVEADDIRVGEGQGPPDAVAELLDGTVDEISDAITAGEYDDQLDAIEGADERKTVQDAAANRRDDLEGEGGD